MHIVPGVGHHGDAMSAVALRMFYDKEKLGTVDTNVLDFVTGDDMG